MQAYMYFKLKSAAQLHKNIFCFISKQNKQNVGDQWFWGWYK